jgi:CubicO group peptidase (beta-lactamase class C family)
MHTYDVNPVAAGFAPGRLDRITDHLERRYLSSAKIAGCQTLVARHGQVAYVSSLGKMDVQQGRPMTDDAIFRLYSMTKPITSVALMSLYEQGHFQLNDPVSRFIPSWKKHQVWVSGEGPDMKLEEPRRPMTVRDLLGHTSGLTYGSLLSSIGVDVAPHPVDAEYDRLGVRRTDETLPDFIAKLGEVPLRYHPGERWMYSLATDVCGHLVEVISGQRFDEYLRSTIFDPLGMVDTAFSVAPDKRHRFTSNYMRGRDKALVCIDSQEKSTYFTEPAFLSGGGGLTGTLADYFRFTEMLRRGGELDGQRILGPRTIEMMRRNHLFEGRDLTQMAIGAFSETANAGVGFGLGFASSIDQVATGTLGRGDFYWGGAASTIFWVDPDEDLVVIFLTQLMPSSTFDFRGQLKSIVYSSIAQ